MWCAFVALLACVVASTFAVRCLDCVGENCMGNFCEGDYCVLGKFAPRWGASEWLPPTFVKGCVKGSLLRKDIRQHCEISSDSKETFACFCNKKNCNSGKPLSKLAKERVPMVTCVCKGIHCSGSTCLGEMCSYVVNHITKEVEQGCVNASLPLVERRSMGSCMMPPISGAMHHSIAKDPVHLLRTESCVCASDYCNSEKPVIEVEENQSCEAYVKATVWGKEMASKTSKCNGEYCFKAHIKSKLGAMTEYSTIGCASFTGDDALAEELNPIGCANFTSEKLTVMACYTTKDKDAIGRARANQEGKEDEPNNEFVIEQEEEDNGKEESEEEEKEEKEVVSSTAKATAKAATTTTPGEFIFEKPTQPPVPDDSNTTMITVFVLLILCILASGLVIKLQLHRKLFRSNYDTVAGG